MNATHATQRIATHHNCEIKAVQSGHHWQVWFRTLKQAQKNAEFRLFTKDSFDHPEAAIAHFKAFLEARNQTPWLFTESGKFLGRSLETWQA